MIKLIDGKWDPFRYIVEIQKEIDNQLKTITEFNRSIQKNKLEIERALRFIKDNDLK